MSRRDRYTCTLERNADGAIELIAVGAVDADGAERHTRLAGDRVAVTAEPFRRILQRGGVRGGELAGSGSIDLDSRTGVQAELLLNAVAPLRRGDRIAVIGDRIAEMGPEEAAYWHAKTTRRGGLQALRILLQEGAP